MFVFVDQSDFNVNNFNSTTTYKIKSLKNTVNYHIHNSYHLIRYTPTDNCLISYGEKLTRAM